VSDGSGSEEAVAEGLGRPALEVVRGEASPEELAALVAVLTAAGAEEPSPPRRPPSRWVARPRAARGPLHPGPGAWRASGFPH
jgi:hypothetical protein